MGKLGPFNKWCENFRNATSWILSDSPHQSRKISRNRWTWHPAMKSYLKISGFSDEEMTSAPEIAPTDIDDSEVRKDPQVTCQTKSASTRAETPVAEATEPARVPPMPKVDQNPSIARSSTARPFSPQKSTVQQSPTSQPTTTLPTDSPSRTDVPVEPMSQSQAMKRPLEQILQPESKRMSLGEEHGILAVEDLRWLPRQRPRGVRCPLKCWNPDTAEGRGQVLTPLCTG